MLRLGTLFSDGCWDDLFLTYVSDCFFHQYLVLNVRLSRPMVDVSRLAVNGDVDVRSLNLVLLGKGELVSNLRRDICVSSASCFAVCLFSILYGFVSVLSCQRSLRLKWDAPRISAVTFSFCSGGRCCD